MTESGQIEAHDWLTDLIATPVKEYPEFEAALSFLPALPPADVVGLLAERAVRLESECGRARATRELAATQGLPRLFSIEGEFRTVLRQAELDFVRQLIDDIESGALGGVGLVAGRARQQRRARRPTPVRPEPVPERRPDRRSGRTPMTTPDPPSPPTG